MSVALHGMARPRVGRVSRINSSNASEVVS